MVLSIHRFMKTVFVGRNLLLLLLTASICCCHNKTESYLESLHLKEISVEPSEIIDLEQYNIFLATHLVVYEDWAVLKESQSANLVTILNLKTGEHFGLLRQGRGPGELQNPNSLTGKGEDFTTGDTGTRTFVSVNIPRSVLEKSAVMDTILKYGIKHSSISNPVWVKDGCFVSSCDSYPEIGWYALRDPRGEVLSTVSPPFQLQLKEMELAFRSSFLSSSFFITNPAGDRICVSMNQSETISFAVIENGQLHELVRYENTPPPVHTIGGTTHFDSDARQYFGASAADDRYVYLTYSGRKLFDSKATIPSYEKDHLIVYDWGGKPQYHFRLRDPVLGVYLYQGRLYCTTTYPTSKILVYNLPIYN